ncbi:translation initiation factor 4E [Cotonvirus japonicus]|uniref:Translation initiation factor 4E n=1 Tax=Cotonvirus japonicus TaxID=2811091 RepID=A0ABM7NSG4_9VIRU|nr:translation initiation factor 4E [Cotonvirus japonicus]BCS83037.1 translation initiation factor 4E [Cotonvirus japonicus]
MDTSIVDFHNINNIPDNVTLTNIKLPNEWVLYLYDKQLFKKMANRPNFQAKPHKALCTISTVNDLVYILELMKSNNDSISKSNTGEIKTKINLDANDYIIMRKGIEPIWEDPKNSNGGTFTIKMDHSKGYDVWMTFVMYILGETLTDDMNNINGITVSYISDAYSFQNPTMRNSLGTSSFTYIKIWDSKSDRTREQFIGILPPEILNKIKSESLMYSQNNKKKDFNEKNIINKLNSSKRTFKTRGGFNNFGPKRY